MNILRYDDLQHGGFAGLEERQFVMDQRVFGIHKKHDAAEGLGQFVYLADANFLPHGETGAHPHHEVDVISVMVSGRIHHEGSLEHGQALNTGMVQVQRAGSEGFTHNEINPDEQPNQMIQLWVLPEERGQPAGYQVYQTKQGERQHVYGGNPAETDRFDSHTLIDVAALTAGQTVSQSGDVMLYISKGSGVVNGETVTPRTLIRAKDVTFTAEDEVQIILIYLSDATR